MRRTLWSHGVGRNSPSAEAPLDAHFRVQDDMVAEHWACRDDVGGFRQLGTRLRSA
jgi:hypothetical protein